MLQYYKENYCGTLALTEGPVVSYIDQNKNNKKVKLTDLDRTDKLKLEGLEKRIKEAMRVTLKDKSGPGDSFTDEEKELMIWYQYFFLGRGKPSTHMQFLSSINDEELIKDIPPVFERMVKCVEELLGDSKNGKE